MSHKKAKHDSGVESYEKDGAKYVRLRLDDDECVETNLFGMVRAMVSTHQEHCLT